MEELVSSCVGSGGTGGPREEAAGSGRRKEMGMIWKVRKGGVCETAPEGAEAPEAETLKGGVCALPRPSWKMPEP